MSEGALAQLEDTFTEVVRILKLLQAENTSLKQELLKLERELEEAKRENQAKWDLINRLENDRLQILTRVERVFKAVTALEQSIAEAGVAG